MSRGRRVLARVLAVCLAGLGGSCQLFCPEPPIDMRPVYRWLVCVDCGNGVLDSVRALGLREGRVVDSLIRLLKDGPPIDSISRMEAVLGAAFDRDTSFGHKTSVDLVKAGLNDRALHVSRYRALYVQRYRDRSVVALGCVGTAAATAEVATVGTAAGPPVTPEIVSLAKDSLGSQGERDRRCRTP